MLCNVLLPSHKLAAHTIPTLLLLDCLIIIIRSVLQMCLLLCREQSLTLLPFSGLHLHPVLQSNPAQGSSIFTPCRNKEKKMTGVIKHLLGTALMGCWFMIRYFDILHRTKSSQIS